MVLGEGLEDADGTRHAMAGLLGHSTSFAKRRLTLGYREARLAADGPVSPRGTTVRGHEFHYATLTDPGRDAPFAEIRDGQGQSLGPAGGRRGLVSGGLLPRHCDGVRRSTARHITVHDLVERTSRSAGSFKSPQSDLAKSSASALSCASAPRPRVLSHGERWKSLVFPRATLHTRWLRVLAEHERMVLNRRGSRCASSTRSDHA